MRKIVLIVLMITVWWAVRRSRTLIAQQNFLLWVAVLATIGGLDTKATTPATRALKKRVDTMITGSLSGGGTINGNLTINGTLNMAGNNINMVGGNVNDIGSVGGNGGNIGCFNGFALGGNNIDMQGGNVNAIGNIGGNGGNIGCSNGFALGGNNINMGGGVVDNSNGFELASPLTRADLGTVAFTSAGLQSVATRVDFIMDSVLKANGLMT